MAENQILVTFTPKGDKELINAINKLATAQKTLEKRFVEVKSMSFRSPTANWRPNTMINRQLTPLQKQLGVELIYYNIETGDIKYA